MNANVNHLDRVDMLWGLLLIVRLWAGTRFRSSVRQVSFHATSSLQGVTGSRPLQLSSKDDIRARNGVTKDLRRGAKGENENDACCVTDSPLVTAPSASSRDIFLRAIPVGATTFSFQIHTFRRRGSLANCLHVGL